MREGTVTLIPEKGKPKTEPLRFHGPYQTLRIESERIARHFLCPVDDRLLDFLEIATAVYYADRSFRRGGDSHPDHGAVWRRTLRFDLGVRDLAFWSRSDVAELLVDTVRFLTDDTVSLAFFQADLHEPAEPYFSFDPDAGDAFKADEVVMYSGGLDSVAGIVETLASTSRSLALVTHRAAPKLITGQKDIVQSLSRRWPGRLLWIEVRATRVGTTAPDTTQRSRSFLFTALGLAVARMFGASGITFFENGIVSQNLPLATQVVGTLATRTTHPLALRKLADLSERIVGEPFPVRNPFELQTKSEVVERFRAHGAENLIASTVSCNGVHGRSREFRHCGSCSQCLDRTFALLATGLADHEKPDDFETPVLTGARDTWRSRTMALEWVRHAVSLRHLDPMQFLQRHSGELTRLAEGFPDRPPFAAMEAIHALHTRHGAAVLAGLTTAIRTHGEILATGTLPPTCLLRLYVGTDGSLIDAAAPVPSPEAAVNDAEVTPAMQASDGSGLPLQVAFVNRGHVRVRYLAEFGPPKSALLFVLKAPFDADRERRSLPEHYTCTRAGDLADALSLDETYVRQIVSRIRQDLREVHDELYGVQGDGHLLIHARDRKGYRLDPTILVIREPFADDS